MYVLIKLIFATIILELVLTSTLNSARMKNISVQLSEDLSELNHDELGIDYVKKLYASFKYTTSVIDANQTIIEIGRKLETKIDDIFLALSRAKTDIETMQVLTNSTRSVLLPCRQPNDTRAEPGADLMHSYNASRAQLKLDYIVQKMRSQAPAGVKQRYLLTARDLGRACAAVDRGLLWRGYSRRGAPRRVVLVVDHGAALSALHLRLARRAARQVVGALGAVDRLALLAVAGGWSAPAAGCAPPARPPRLAALTAGRRGALNRFIDGVGRGAGATNHTLAFEAAFGAAAGANGSVMIVYVSRGLLSSLTEARAVLEVIRAGVGRAGVPVVINTVAVIDEQRPTIYETQFMEDVALQNYQKYNLSEGYRVRRGAMVAINSTEAVGFAISGFFRFFDSEGSYELKPTISYPIWDPIANDLTISFSIGCWNDNHFGHLGIDAYFINIAEDIIYFNNNKNNRYIFMIDLKGHTFLHPSFASLITINQQLNYVDISYFENELNSDFIVNRLLKERNGVHQIISFGQTIKYTWIRLQNWYILCLVNRNTQKLQQIPYHVTWPVNNTDNYGVKLIFQHFGGGLDEPKLCKHLNQVATLDAGSLYLSPSCFKAPSHLKQTRHPDESIKYMSYLQDPLNRLPNPGLKDDVKDEVAALSHILNFFRTQHLFGLRSRYIVRRYVASHGGVLEMFPGSILAAPFDPTRRPWFRQAAERAHTLVATPPYLDAGGAGYIVTLAYATPHVVVGVDVTYGYVYKMLLNRAPFCQSSNVTCFLLDDRAYLVYHPNLMEPYGHGPIEKQHIVHKESLVANDILTYKYFISKYLCNSYGDGTIQRFYKLNTSYDQLISNTVQSEPCVSYTLAPIFGTNLFIGVVNASCNVVETFCPCSIVDRLCLNCNRMEQKECECPCECPLLENECIDANPLCRWFPEHGALGARFEPAYSTAELRSCFAVSCGGERDHFGCLGVTGCEWCRFDVDGSALKAPFCASMAACFNGVVGSLTPYSNASLTESGGFLSLPVFGLVGIVALVGVACGFYYLRRGRGQMGDRLYLASMQDNQLRMSDLNLSDNYHSAGNHRDKLLQGERNLRLDAISPYCVSGGYRRGFLAADSDHGYSTMTQQDESERMSLAPADPDSLEEDLGSDEVSSGSVTVGRVKSTDLGLKQTCIPKNCIVVPVTVHCNREAT